jgi:3'-phosphoadenosine 5'-phosphosulfate sulfotransferase (PAPS reductase)/FAD synthetase
MIAVWFSCGAASAVALKMTVDKYGIENVRAVNNPVAEEHHDNQRFADDVAAWVGIELEYAVNSKYPLSSVVDVFDRRKGMSFPHGAPCTVELKKRARQEWERDNQVEWHVLGFTVDERDRHDRFVMTERENVLPVLIDANMTKNDCADYLRSAGIRLPAIYNHGFPNANCIGCVKATSPTYWNLVRREFPEVFDQRAEQSRRLGAKLVRVKNERIFLDQLDPSAKGRPLKTMPDCGLFCEEGEEK